MADVNSFVPNIGGTNSQAGDGVTEKWRDAGDGTWQRVGAVVSVGGDGAPGSALPAGTDKSGTTTGASQLIAAANTARRFLQFTNSTGLDMWLTELVATAGVSLQGCERVPNGAQWFAVTNRAVYGYCATASLPYAAVEG